MSAHTPASRQELIDYCLRKLGSPVIEINLDPDQIEDAFEEALQFCREFHFEFTETQYAAEKVEGSKLDLQSGNGLDFQVGDIITGNTSNSTAFVYSVDANFLMVKDIPDIQNTFQDNESITGSKSGATGTTSASNALTLGNYDKKYFNISDDVWSVVRALQFNSASSSIGLFDVQYQLMLNNLPTLTSIDLGYYAQLKTYLNLLNDMLTGTKPIRYNRHTNRLYLDTDWKRLNVGKYVVFEVFRIYNPDDFTDVYNDLFLKKYMTAVLKRQWGINMKKFEGVQLPGGVTMNGQKIYDEAVEEIEQFKQECQLTYQWPIDFFLG